MDKKNCLLLMTVAVIIGLICLVVLDLAFMDRAAVQAAPPKEIVGKDGAKMVLVPAGKFEMGTDPAEIPGLVQWVKKLRPGLDVKAEWFEAESPAYSLSGHLLHG